MSLVRIEECSATLMWDCACMMSQGKVIPDGLGHALRATCENG